MSAVQSGALPGAPFCGLLIQQLRSTDLLVRSLVSMFLLLFRVVDLETSNGLMPAAAELMMLNILLIVPGVEHTMLNFGVNLRLLVLRPRESMLLHESRIMSEPGIL